MNFNDNSKQIFIDKTNALLTFPDLNNKLPFKKNIDSGELVSSSNIDFFYSSDNTYIIIEEMDDNYNDSNNIISSRSNPIIEEIEEEDKYKVVNETKKKYSDIFFNIDVNEKCHSCSLDSYTLIQKDEELFHSFLNTTHIFQQSLFNFMKNLITNQ